MGSAIKGVVATGITFPARRPVKNELVNSFAFIHFRDKRRMHECAEIWGVVWARRPRRTSYPVLHLQMSFVSMQHGACFAIVRNGVKVYMIEGFQSVVPWGWSYNSIELSL